jgi:signal transduction histidine kinase
MFPAALIDLTGADSLSATKAPPVALGSHSNRAWIGTDCPFRPVMPKLAISSLLVPFALAAAPASETIGPELTTAAAVRSLADAREFQPHPVRLQGVVLLPPPPRGNSFVLADDTACIYVEADPAQCAGLERGVVAAIRGRAMQGRFAPFVAAGTVVASGAGTIPPPVEATFDQLLSGRCDAQWVTVAGTVRRVRPALPPDGRQFVEIATGGGRLGLNFRDAQPTRLQVDEEIRVAGIAFYQFSRTGQIIRPILTVPSGVTVEVTRPSPGVSPLRRIDRLLSFFTEGTFGHRVRVRGVVTHQQPGEALWLEQDRQAIRINLDDPITYGPGEAVEVTGFIVLGNYSPELEDVTVRRLAVGSIRPPAILKSASAALDHDAGLVTLEARLIETIPFPQGLRFILRDGDHDFAAHLRTDQGKSVGRQWAIGSLVRATGICSVARLPFNQSPGTMEPSDFELTLRSPADLEVIKAPSWWNADRVVRLLGLSTIGLGGVAVFVFSRSRRRLRQSAAARRQSEAEFAAILAERNRIAREIHDTLAQSLGAILLQHGMLNDLVPVGSEAQAHLIEANEITRSALAEARESIWNMRSQALEDHGLGGALAGILDQLTDNDDINGAIEISGEPFLLPPMVENNLLRIGQEAITNAVKHASAKRIDILLEYTPNQVILRVHDDGHGFDPEVVDPKDRHFGLAGMRERASELGANLRLDSSPAHGTVLILELPLPDRG